MSSPLRVVVDARPLVGHRTGIGVHTAEIAARLPFDPPPLLAAHAPIDDRTGIERLPVRVDRGVTGGTWQQLTLPRVLAAEKADVLWGPHGTLPLRGATPAVATLHDLTSITAPFGHELRTVVSFNALIAPSLRRAAEIAAVSKRTAEEVSRGFGIPLGRIEIVPNGVGDAFGPQAGDASLLPPGVAPREYVLYVGTLEPRKGIADLVDAWEGLAPRPRLVLCGDPGWGLARLRGRIESHARRGEIVVTGFVERRVLASLYRFAKLFVYPSRQEGFGIPPLEAMACGAPVVATRAGAIEEVAGDAALLVAPGDRAALAGAIRGLLADAPLRAELAGRGIARAARYSWRRSAAIMAELLIRAAAGPRYS
ncbi:MAG TPA: glycosyltransferase family 1 protein [Thermoanaerobaculia bacterium]